MPRGDCAIPDCDKPAHAMGWCNMHHSRWKRHGDPLSVMGPGVPRTDSPTYFTRHARVKRTRGSAAQHPCVGCCERQAQHWATIHGEDGLDIFADYVPLCAGCHHQYDAETARRARGSACGNAVLNETQVADIKAALRDGQTVASIARAYGRPWPTIDGIKTGRTWRHVS